MNLKKYRTEKDKVLNAENLVQIMNKIDILYEEFAKRYGLNYNSLGIYQIIYENQPCTQKSISGKWGLSKQTVSSICKELKKKNMIEYESSEKDRREKAVRLTYEGRKFAEPVIRKLREIENSVLEEMDSETRYWIFKSSETFYELFNKKMKEVKE